jgi:superfamily II DNA or RNA helicase
MSVTLELRAWQSKFARALAAHDRDDFLLVACPAAGKTIAAAVGVADAMGARDCDQLIVVCPTVVVRDQWASELNRLGYRMLTHVDRRSLPEHVHGTCTTYAQVAQRVHELADACQRRRTVVVFDEIHHAGEQLAWGASIADAFRDTVLRLTLSGTPFRSDSSRIPFVRYDRADMCVPDFAYDYARAVRDGACRPIEFRAHDGEITWLDDDGETHAKASFSQGIPREDQPRRLRASLDPDQPYLRSLLAAAHADVLRLRRTVPDAAGLVVCDSQLHALDVDRLLTEITGSLPVLAMSDIPRAHQAIRSFAEEDDPWIVSVRMVAEGVDIPRLGVIAWATTARTELMVRQVAGRALRGRGEHASLPAIVHMPADPQLVQYARRIDVLGGVSHSTVRRPRVFLEDTDEPTTGSRRRRLKAVAAHPADVPLEIAPELPAGRLHSAPEPIQVATPELPDAPEDLAAAQESRQASRAELYQLLAVYAQLRRTLNPAYQLASAHTELAAEVGAIGPESPDEHIAEALEWVHERTAAIAVRHPDAIKDLARSRRRLKIAEEAVA